MSLFAEEKVYYFVDKGQVNTDKTIEIALSACKERHIGKMVIASSTGRTAIRLSDMAGKDIEITAVTYSAGSKYQDDVETFNQNRDLLAERGINIVRGLHALSGVERAFENKYKTPMIPLNIVADTLRIFCHGIKVCVEIAVMAAEHGFITPEEEVVVVAGSHRGADTAVVLKPAYGARLFDMRIKALLCMPT